MRSALQIAFKAMLRDRIAPPLRDLGLKGSGTQYRLETPGHWAWLAFQATTSNARDRIRFTVNLSVVERAAWEAARRERPTLPEQPTAHVAHTQFTWWERIGNVMPVGRDHWWEFVLQTDPAPLAHEVVATVREYGLPAVRAHM